VSCKVPKCVDGGQCVELGCLQQYSESMLVNNVKCTCVRVLQGRSGEVYFFSFLWLVVSSGWRFQVILLMVIVLFTVVSIHKTSYSLFVYTNIDIQLSS
jgi:hypothetical protein